MNLIRDTSRLSIPMGKRLSHRFIQSSSTLNTNDNLILEPLIEREVIQVKGSEVEPFLQGLVTNDIKHLHPSVSTAIYAMFLNKGGRIMYDTILYSTSDPKKILIECDKNVANELQRHLKLYRVRRKIDINSLSHEFKVWQAYKLNKTEDIINTIHKEKLNDIVINADPRLKQLGIRLLAKSDKTYSDVSQIFKRCNTILNSGDSNFRFLRYSLGIAEGVLDMPPGKCFPLEANCDILNGVSFHKGCYIGQELTARVHHTGMVRKRHMPLKLTAPLHTDAKVIVRNETGANCGTICGNIADRALGLLRVENVLKAKELLVNGSLCFTERPPWWPIHLHYNILKDVRKKI